MAKSHRTSYPSPSRQPASQGPEPDGQSFASVQPKLEIGVPGDGFEREADRMADAVVGGKRASVTSSTATGSGSEKAVQRRPQSEGNEEDGMVQAKAEGAGVAAPKGFGGALSAAKGSGKALEGGVRSQMESSFGANFGNVRVHADSRAGELAGSIKAKAFTHGNDIYFNRGQFNPESKGGQHLLAHELTHTIQQGGGEAGNRIQRSAFDPGADLTLQDNTADEFWEEFDIARRMGNDEGAMALGRRMVRRMQYDDRLMDYGPEVIAWMATHGDAELAVIVAGMMQPVITERFGEVDQQLDIEPMPALFGNARFLIDGAKALAEGGDHAGAAEVFVAAYLYLQVQLDEASRTAYTSLSPTSNGAGELPAGTSKILRDSSQDSAYSNVGPLYELMREIFAYYPQQEIAALRAGDQATALEMQQKGSVLAARLMGDAVLAGKTPRGDKLDSLTMTTRSAGAGTDDVIAEGVNGVEEELTPFTGSPRLDDLNSSLVYSADFSDVASTLAGQEGLIAELYRIPSIQEAFPAADFDLNDTTQRQQIWGLLFEDLRANGSENPLQGLTGIMERYQQAYTFHTGFNVRDFGTNYLESEFPTDLMGRLMRDCGVYGLTAAHDLFTVGKAAGLNWSFETIAMMNHATVVLYDHDNKVHYVVSNDQIIGPKTGNPYATVAAAYGEATDHDNSVFSGIRQELGDTSMEESDFTAQAWDRYKRSTQWELAPVADPKLTPDMQVFKGQEQYYETLDDYDGAMRDVQAVVNVISNHFTSDPAAALELFTSEQQALGNFAEAIMLAFHSLGPRAKLESQRGSGLVESDRIWVYFSALPEGGTHPLVRLAMVFEHFKVHTEGGINEQMQGYLDFICSYYESPTGSGLYVDLLPAMCGQLEAYRKAGAPASF